MIRRCLPEHVTDYASYLAWQGSKAALPSQDKIFANRYERVRWFRDRFRCLGIGPGRAMCLGSRYGEEVEALLSRGWTASGIDIHESPPFVERGDMNEPLPGKFDLIYTNAFDHCWEPKQFVENIRDGLNPSGRLMLHVSNGQPGEFESVAWDEIEDVLELLKSCGFDVLRLTIAGEFYGLTTEIVCRC